MIETTYVRLTKAAEMMGADADTLLIAAAEGRIRLFWLLNALVEAERGRFEETGEPSDQPRLSWVMDGYEIKRFTFVPLQSHDAAELLKRPDTLVKSVWLSEPDDEGYYWQPYDGGPDSDANLLESEMHVTRDCVFLKRADVEAIKAAQISPAPGTVKDAPSRQTQVPRDNSLIGTIAALLDCWPGGPQQRPSDRELEKAAERVGAPVSNSTIGYVLRRTKAAAPGLKLTK